MFITLYVDDLIFNENNLKSIDDFKYVMITEFEMTDFKYVIISWCCGEIM